MLDCNQRLQQCHIYFHYGPELVIFALKVAGGYIFETTYIYNPLEFMPKINNKLQMVLVWLTFYPVSKFKKKNLFKKTKDIDVLDQQFLCICSCFGSILILPLYRVTFSSACHTDIRDAV